MADLLALSGLTIGVLMLGTWVVSVIVDDASIVDIVWGFGFIAATGISYLAGPVDTLTDRSILVLAMVSLWGLRLTGYLAWRKIGKGEDRRYQHMRRRNPDSFWILSLFKVFGPQAVLMWIVAVPAVVVHATDSPLSWLDYVGVGLWLVGMFFETAADFQLARFRARPDSSGAVLDTGLWRFSRHPNYFGDFCVWWGIYLVAAAGGVWWSVVSPLVMSALLMRYSGVGPTERDIARRRRGYPRYQEMTNAFFPGPPRGAG